MEARLTPDIIAACAEGDCEFAVEEFTKRCKAAGLCFYEGDRLWCGLKCLLTMLSITALDRRREDVRDAYLSFKNYCEVDIGIE